MTETNIILNTPIKAVNIGLSLLGDALKQQEIETVQIDWRMSTLLHVFRRFSASWSECNENDYGTESRFYQFQVQTV